LIYLTFRFLEVGLKLPEELDELFVGGGCCCQLEPAATEAGVDQETFGGLPSLFRFSICSFVQHSASVFQLATKLAGYSGTKLA